MRERMRELVGRSLSSGDPEDVAYWFFRLNGCLTIRNFIVHPDRRGSQRTDADLLALRFPWRKEQEMVDHVLFRDLAKPVLLLVEVKSSGPCRLNGPWTDPSAANLPRIIEAIGSYDNAETQLAAESLYKEGRYTASAIEAALVAVGEVKNQELAESAPGALQLDWGEILEFIHHRFRLFRAQKAHHPQWDTAGRRLYDISRQAREDEDRFRDLAHAAFFKVTPAEASAAG